MDATKRTIVNPIRDEKMTFLETSEETGGKYTFVEVDLGSCKAAPEHVHERQTECFEVISGALEVVVDQSATRIEPGESATAPAGSKHGFRNPGPERAVFRVRITPGNPGWEKMMACSFGLVRDGKTRGDMPKSFTDLSVLASWGQTELPRSMRPLLPLFRWRANSSAGARRREELLALYCGVLE